MTGDPRIDELMKPVDKAIERHLDWPSDEFTEIHNRAWEAVAAALRLSQQDEAKPSEKAKRTAQCTNPKH